MPELSTGNPAPYPYHGLGLCSSPMCACLSQVEAVLGDEGGCTDFCPTSCPQTLAEPNLSQVWRRSKDSSRQVMLRAQEQRHGNAGQILKQFGMGV